jgi:hypothetical protein
MPHPIKFKVGDRLPVTLSREQLAGVIGKTCRRLDMLHKQLSHPAIKELLPRVGHPRYSGATAQAWLDQQPIEEPRQFFASARRLAARSK